VNIVPPLNYNAPSAIRAFLDERGLGMRKRFGQNFLINPSARARLLDALEAQAGEEVWEIGSGLGAMTAGLLDRGLAVRAFEIDPGFCAALRDFFGAIPGFTLVEGDVLKTWPRAGAAPYLLGNLPYNIGATLLGDFIERRRFFSRMVVMVQREVARRMCARPLSKDYCAFSVLCASAYRVRPLMTLKGACFYPPPRVDSEALCLDLHDGAGSYPALLQDLVRCLFSSRRKTIRNNLRVFVSSRWPSGEDLVEEVLKAAGLSGNERAESLSLEDFVFLTFLTSRSAGHSPSL
jgi:16S rRNA (adenine1518-N6/adenine1519-N6)-dimethyltransferase